MESLNFFENFIKELRHNLPVAELYDFDRNKERIRLILLSAKINCALLDTLPHVLFDGTDYAGVFSLDLFRDGTFHFGSYITHDHLALWKITADDLVRLATGST